MKNLVQALLRDFMVNVGMTFDLHMKEMEVIYSKINSISVDKS